MRVKTNHNRRAGLLVSAELVDKSCVAGCPMHETCIVICMALGLLKYGLSELSQDGDGAAPGPSVRANHECAAHGAVSHCCGSIQELRQHWKGLR